MMEAVTDNPVFEDNLEPPKGCRKYTPIPLQSPATTVSSLDCTAGKNLCCSGRGLVIIAAIVALLILAVVAISVTLIAVFGRPSIEAAPVTSDVGVLMQEVSGLKATMEMQRSKIELLESMVNVSNGIASGSQLEELDLRISTMANATADRYSKLKLELENLLQAQINRLNISLQLEELNLQIYTLANATADRDSKLKLELEAGVSSLQAQIDHILSISMNSSSPNTNTQTPTTCEGLSPPANGEISVAAGPNSLSYGLGSVATYSCDPGYTIVGEATRVCEDTLGGTVTTGVWSGAPPTCQGIACPNLVAPSHGNLVSTVSDEMLLVGTTTTYSCDPGYVLVGDRSRNCTVGEDGSSGVWSGTMPSCEVIIRCGNITSPNNGGVSISLGTHGVNLGVGSVATYSCNTGYGLVGGATRTCDSDGGTGTWSGSQPTCQEVITCHLLTPPSDGTLTFSPGANNSNIGLGSVATYSCNTGYVLVGQTMRTCQSIHSGAAGAWSGHAPYCREVVYCPALSSPGNGTVSISSGVDYLSVGSVATYSCDPGYALLGSSTRSCVDPDSDSVGTWTGVIPICQVILCPELLAPSNGSISFSFTGIQLFGVGTTATYSCDPGVVLVGYATRTCNEQGGNALGVWSGSETTCAVPNDALIDCQNELCRQNTLACPEDENCTVQCHDFEQYACYQANVFCPSREGNCIVNCDDSYACLQAHTTCPQGNCTINCEYGNTCTHSALKCSGENCLLNCQSACDNTRVNCLSGSCTADCTQTSTCANVEFTTCSGKSCSMNCRGSSSCTNLTIGCSGDSCQADCLGPSSCSNLAINCSGDSCLMDCRGYLSCRNPNIRCLAGNCTILAKNYRTLNSSTVLCPQDGPCLINCTGNNTCRDSQFTCPSGGNCVFSFQDPNKIVYTSPSLRRYNRYYESIGRSSVITCQENSTCNISCRGIQSNPSKEYFECYNSRITCDSGDCTVDCSGYEACRSSTIVCGRGSGCLTCSGNYACRSATIVCGRSSKCSSCSGQYSCNHATITLPNPSSDIASLECTGSSSCRSASITCPENNTCSVGCTGGSACSSATINCPANDNCSIKCTENYACQSTNINCPQNGTCGIRCSDIGACRSARIRCPANNECDINCNATNSCQQTFIICPANHNCTINCDGQNSCDNARVICPTGDYSCNILCADPLSCSNLSITNTHNVYLQCCGDLSCAGTTVTPSSTECRNL